MSTDPTMTHGALRGQIVLCDDADTIAEEAAAWIAELSEECTRARKPFRIALSGGSTPKLLYERLAGDPWRTRIDWSMWRVFFGDERACLPSDPQSNYSLAQTALFSKVPIDPSHVFRMHGEDKDLAEAAANYESVIREELPDLGDEPPPMDLVLLGMGDNGHTASLFPATPALSEERAWVTPGLADYEPYARLTFTLPLINASRHVAFMIAGASKAPALAKVAEGHLPASRVNPQSGRLTWFIDSAAAAELPAHASAL